MRARCQPVANAPRTRCHRVRSPPLDPPSDRLPPSPPLLRHRPLATGHWLPATGTYPLSTTAPQSAPAVPCKSLRNVLYCKVEPEHNQAGPERAASHNCPPTMPRPQTMPTCPEPNVRILPQANFAPGSAGNSSKCAELPSVALPTHSVVTHAMQPMPAPPAPGSVSCHEKHAAVVVLRTIGTQNDIFCAFSRQKRQGTDRGRILLRESMSISCHEETEKFFKVRPNRPKQAIRYPIDTLSIPDFPRNSQPLYDTIRRSWANSGQNQPHFLRTCAALPTRRLTPRLTSTLISARAGEVARNEVLYSPKRPNTTFEYVVETPVHQRMNREGMSWSHDDVQAMFALRARLLSGSWREIAI